MWARGISKRTLIPVEALRSLHTGNLQMNVGEFWVSTSVREVDAGRHTSRGASELPTLITVCSVLVMDSAIESSGVSRCLFPVDRLASSLNGGGGKQKGGITYT